MARNDYEIEATISNTSSNPEDYSRAYMVIRKARGRMKKAIGELKEVMPKEFDFCNTVETFNALNNIRKSISEIMTELTRDINLNLTGSSSNSETIEIPDGSQRFQATTIVLKEYQLLRYECERNLLIVKRTIAETTKKMLVGLFDGEGSNEIAPIQAPMTTLSTFGAIAGKAIDALGMLLSFLDKMSVLNVNSSGCCFFATPKSFKKTDIEIKNSNSSLTNNIPDWMDKLLSEAEQKIKESVAGIRDRDIARMKANGGNSAASGELDTGGMGELPGFDSETIRAARKALLQTLLDADGLPRYEDLKITNVRFLTYLVTGFEPAAHKSFGIPGFP